MTDELPAEDVAPGGSGTEIAGSRTKIVAWILMAVAGIYAVGALVLAGGRVSAVAASLPAASQLAAVIGLVLLGFALRAGRWLYFSRVMQWRVPALPNIVVFMASFALTATPGKAGELLKSALLRTRYGVPASQSAGVLIVERLGDLFAMLMLASVGLALFVDVRLYFLVAVAIVAAIAFVLYHPALSDRMVALVARIAPLRKHAEALGRLLGAARGLLRPSIFAAGVAFALLGWTCEGTAFYLLCKTLPVAVPLRIAVSIYALSSIAGALSMLPGGFGGVEAVMILLLAHLGAPPARAAVIVVLFRLVTLYFATLLGAAFLAWWQFLPANPVRGVAKPD